MGEHKSKPQIFQVELRTVERFALCDLMLGTTVKGRIEERRFSRVFEACGLEEYEPMFTEGPIVAPDDTGRVFTLTAEVVDYIQDLLEKTPLSGKGARRLGPLLRRFEAVKAGDYTAPGASDNGVTSHNQTGGITAHTVNVPDTEEEKPTAS
jgi:hypothetical protein